MYKDLVVKSLLINLAQILDINYMGKSVVHIEDELLDSLLKIVDNTNKMFDTKLLLFVAKLNAEEDKEIANLMLSIINLMVNIRNRREFTNFTLRILIFESYVVFMKLLSKVVDSSSICHISTCCNDLFSYYDSYPNNTFKRTSDVFTIFDNFELNKEYPDSSLRYGKYKRMVEAAFNCKVKV